MARPGQCFISYSHHDHGHFEKLLVNVQAVSNIYGFPLWFDRRIRAGNYWNATIQAEIAKSDIFVCLTTNAFFSSDYIFNSELPAIIERHGKANALVLPVVFEECIWKSYFGSYIELAPKDRKHNLVPVAAWKNRDQALGIAANAIGASIADWFGVGPAVDFKTPVLAVPVSP
jgi:TIR domain